MTAELLRKLYRLNVINLHDLERLVDKLQIRLFNKYVSEDNQISED